MYTDWLIDKLRSPENLAALNLNGNYFESGKKAYEIKDGILSIVYPEDLSGDDAKFNRIYNMLAPLYDLNERVMGKLLTGVDMIKGRREIVSLLGLKPGMRILEVSPGPGVFQKYLRNEIGEDGQLVAIDLSMGMLRQCKKKNGPLNVQLIHGNAQFLPFADNSFDALFQFGTVSWGDEGFSENYKNERRKRLLLKINPGFGKPHPTIPDSVCDIKENEVYDGLAYLMVARKR